MKRKRIRILLGGLAVAIVIMALLFPLHVERAGPSPVNRVVSLADTYIIVIGHPVLAQGADYTCDGVADNVQFQQALNDLPAGGGQLFVLTGDYQWADLATVTRAIDNVSIIGVGHSVSFTGDGVTDIFSAGGNNWFFSNLEAGAPGIDMGATTDWMWLHLTNAGTYYSVLTEDDELGDVVGPASATDEAIARFDGATGKLIQDYTSDAPTISDTGDITMSTGKTVDGRDVSVDGTKLDGIDTGATLYPDTGEQAFLDADHNKLDAIEAGADVTDATNVAAAGALMDPDIDNVDDTHLNWGAAAGQVDADDVPASGTRFWAGETGADVTDAANVEAAGALMDAGTDNVDDTHINWGAAAGQVDADDILESATRFWAGETGADVTDATNVDAAGAVMEADFNTQTILIAITDDTPTALVIGEQAVVGRLTGGNIAALNIGVSDNFIVQIDSATITSTEYARFTANGLESRSEAEFKGDYNLQIGVDVQAWDADLDELAGLSDADSNFIVGSATGWVVESDETARASLGFPVDPDADMYLMWDDAPTGEMVWAVAGGGDVATDDIWDAKGDLAVGTGADTADNLPVGTNDYILMADSAQATGLEWVAPGTAAEIAQVQAAGTGSADTYARSDHIHAISHGITDNHIATIDGTILDNDYAKFTTDGLEGMDFSQVLADLSGDAAADFSWNDRLLTAVKGLATTAETELTISSDAITVTQMRHKVDNEGDASSDNLATINGGGTVNLIILRAENDARTVNVQHGTGNIILRGKADIPLDDIEDAVLLVWDSTNSKWFDIAANDITTASITLYVDAGTGSDSNPGTAASPKATIIGALDALPTTIAHPCYVRVRKGTYAEGDAIIAFSRFSMLSSIAILAVNDNDENMYANGLASGGSSTTLTDSSQSWETDQFKDAYIWIYEGLGAGGGPKLITGNTATVITVASWDTDPDSTSYYAIGGGVLMSSTASRHVLVDGKKNVGVYGFRHTGATLSSLHWNNFSQGSCYNNYIPSGLGSGDYAIMVQAFSDVRVYYNYMDISGAGTQFGIRMVQASSWPRGNVAVSDDSTSYGISIERTGIAQMGGTAYRNTLKDCSVGITVLEGSGAQNIAVQTYVSCVTDYSVDATSWST